MKILGACVGLGLLVLVWMAAGSGCTTGNRNRSNTAMTGESCVNKACQAPARCIDVSDKSVGGKACYIPCSGAGMPQSRNECPTGMECRITDFTVSYVCVRNGRLFN